MTLTLIRGHRCEPCARLWHFLCWGRRGALCPESCVCDCRDADGFTTEAAFLESARRAPEQLARHLRFQQAAQLVADGLHPESVESLPPLSVVRAIAERTTHA